MLVSHSWPFVPLSKVCERREEEDRMPGWLAVLGPKFSSTEVFVLHRHNHSTLLLGLTLYLFFRLILLLAACSYLKYVLNRGVKIAHD